jgi:hypothetical protein
MIGGTDVILDVKPGVSAADVILRCVRRHWPACVYQDADDESQPFEPLGGIWPPTLKGSEFFIYRDEQAARSWDEFGATEENANLMLHVLLPTGEDDDDPHSVTIVCGEPVGDVKAILVDIETELAGGKAGKGRG